MVAERHPFRLRKDFALGQTVIRRQSRRREEVVNLQARMARVVSRQGVGVLIQGALQSASASLLPSPPA